MRSKYGYSYIIIYSIVVNCLTAEDSGNIGSFRELYERVPQQRLSAIPREQREDASAETCAESCVKQQTYLCKSFDFDNLRKACYLYSADHEDTHVYTLDDEHVDHYQSAYRRLFDITPKHRLHTWMNSQKDCSVEQCARMCVLETRFKCESFNYDPRSNLCAMTEFSEAEAYGLTVDPVVDFYRRTPEGASVNFMNLGQAALMPLTDQQVYQETQRGLTLDACAQECLDIQSFHCASFDYNHEGDMSLCQLSKFIAANVRGLMPAPNNVRVNHYERIEEELTYFYPTPYAVLLGNDLKTYTLVTPSRCARMCMQEEGFVCRSFNYQVKDGKCTLSDKTGSDVGGLYYGAMQEVHHFEMKPILDCGGNLTGPFGDFASPGWPRNYSHHEQCTWNITVPENKVISLQFTHLAIGAHTAGQCLEGDDRLIVTDAGTRSCILPNMHYLSTKSNQALVTFYSNSEKDAQGFRAFYTADWTCNAHLTSAPGDFASPQWPNNYPSTMLCSWRISAPNGHRVRLYFTSFQLERHIFGHCNKEVDHVKVLDGGTVKAELIALFCGAKNQFDIKSSGTDLFVQFFSDSDRTSQGFHATFVFEPATPGPDDGSAVPPDSGVVDLDTEEGEKGDDDVTSEEKSGDGSSAEFASGDAAASSSVEGGYKHDSMSGGSPRESDPDYRRLSNEYKTAMWAVITLLIIALTAVSVVLFLVWRHYERKIRHITEMVEEDPLLSRDPPLTVTYTVKPNNITLGNEVNLSAQGACAGLTSGAAAAGADPGTPSSSTLAKYRQENLKNVNLDTKQYTDSEALEKKSNLHNNAPTTSAGTFPLDENCSNRYV